MADFASMLYGSAEQAQQSTGTALAGLGQSVNEGVQQQAQLAMHAQDLQMKRQQMQMEMQKVQQAKEDNVWGMIDQSTKIEDSGAKSAFLDGVAKRRDAVGMSQDTLSDATLKALKYPENAARIATLNQNVEAGILAPADRMKIINDPESFQKVPPAASFGKKDLDFSDAAKGYLDRQEKLSAIKLRSEMGAGAKQEKVRQQTEQLLESARGNPAAAQAEKNLLNAANAKSLINMYGDPNQLSNQQVQLLVGEVGKVAQGGAPAMHELDALSPGALKGRLAGVWSKFSNEPTPANAGAFVKQYSDYVDLLQKDSEKVIEDKYGRVLNSAKRALDPRDYQVLRANYVDRFKNATTAGPDSAPKSYSYGGMQFSEMQLRAFLRDHPNDPDTAAVKKLLGGN